MVLGVIVAGVIIIVVYVAWFRPWRWGSTDEEVRGPWPSDELIAEPNTSNTMAITIAAPASEVWPWLVQIGQGRGGFYSYDWLENLFGFEIQNADRIIAKFQHLQAGDRIGLHPQTTPLVVASVTPGRALVLVAGKDLGAEITIDPTFMRLHSYGALSWAFYLGERSDGTTRFAVRFRTRWDKSLREILHNSLLSPAYFIMQRKMCLGLKERAERHREVERSSRASMQSVEHRGTHDYRAEDVRTGPIARTRRKTVLIVGGGIAGLTVAHELSRLRQFDICIAEQNSELGGKARSLRTPEDHPTEHAMRVLLASYTCLFRIMEEIKDSQGSPLMDKLCYPNFSFRYGKNERKMSAAYGGFVRYLGAAFGLVRFFIRCGVPVRELGVFLFRVGRILWSTESQIKARMGRVSFEEYMDVAGRSPGFRDTLLRVSEMLVAAKRTASAGVVARVILEWFVGPFLKSPFQRRGFASLNGPTSERLIEPWAEHLKQAGVQVKLNTRVVEISEDAHEITSVTTDIGETLKADYYCLCLPHMALDTMIQGRLRRFLPTISELTHFGKEWSAGIQYYLREVPPRLRGTEGCVIVDIDSPWSIVHMLHVNGAPWADVRLPADTVAVLSLVMSNGHNTGRHVTRKPFVRCHAEEMKNEALAQIGLFDELKDASYAIGPDLQFISPAAYAKDLKKYEGYGVSKIDDETIIVSDGLLYVRTPQNLDQEPMNHTDIHNLYIAGEFTRTNYSLPTMEKACESGMRCASAICAANGYDYDAQRLVGAELPLAFLRTMWFSVLSRAMAIAVVMAIAWALILGK